MRETLLISTSSNLLKIMNYSRAWHCDKCPQTNNDDGCPCWIEYMQSNPSGDERLKKECLFQALPIFLIEVIKASNRPAAAIESMRNETVIGLDAITQAVLLSGSKLALPHSITKGGKIHALETERCQEVYRQSKNT
jgi:hypothetical protein